MVALMALVLALPVGATTAQAKTKYLPATPKKLRGTWYHYYGKSSGMHKVVITKHGMKDSYGAHKLKAHKQLQIYRTRDKPKGWYVYGLYGKHDIGDGVPFITYVTKVKGKRHRVLGGLAQDIERPFMYTHFNPGKHQLRCPMWTLKKTMDYIK